MISFFELGVADSDKGRAFYGGLFGWSFETGPSGTGWMIGTGGAPGGMHPKDPGATPHVFFPLGGMGAAPARVQALGGEHVPFAHRGETPHGGLELSTGDP